MTVTIYSGSAASAEVCAPLSAILVIMAPPHRRHNALMTVVCLSVCPSVCPVPGPKSRREGHSKLKIGRKEES